MTRLLVTFLLAQALPPGPAERQLAGCYELTVGPLGRPTPPGHFDVIPPPKRVELSLVPLDSTDVPFGRKLRALTPTVYGLAYWRWQARNTVRMAWSTGFVGVELTANRTTDGKLFGHAVWSSDAGPTEQEAPVTGLRVPCK